MSLSGRGRYSPPPGLNVSVARLARASLQQKNIRANVDTLTFKPGGESMNVLPPCMGRTQV